MHHLCFSDVKCGKVGAIYRVLNLDISIANSFGHRFKSDWGSWVRLRMCRWDLSPVWLPGDASAGPAVGQCQCCSWTEWEKLALYQPPRYVNTAASCKKRTWPMAAKRLRADETWFKRYNEVWGRKCRQLFCEKKEPLRTRGCFMKLILLLFHWFEIFHQAWPPLLIPVQLD